MTTITPPALASPADPLVRFDITQYPSTAVEIDKDREQTVARCLGRDDPDPQRSPRPRNPAVLDVCDSGQLTQEMSRHIHLGT